MTRAAIDHPDFLEAMTAGYWESARTVERDRAGLAPDDATIRHETAVKFLYRLAHSTVDRLDRLSRAAHMTLYRRPKPGDQSKVV